MYKILYAAGNRFGSYFQLKRFVSSIRNKNIELKIAAYKSSIGDLDADYTLDCLLNFANTNGSSSKNGNYRYYRNEIKRFAPDLIISDVEVYSSLIALDLGIKLWQASPLLIYNALKQEIKYNTNIHKHYSFLLDTSFRKKKNIYSIIESSNRKFVVSHLCDINKNINLIDGFEWARPDFILSENISNDIEFFVAGSNYRNIINSVKNTNTSIFSLPSQEIFDGLKINNIYDELSYSDYLGKCKVYISDGSEILTSDAFYNQKPIIFNMRHDDVESIIVSHVSEYFGFGKLLSNNTNINDMNVSQIMINNSVKFLHEQLDLI